MPSPGEGSIRGSDRRAIGVAPNVKDSVEVVRGIHQVRQGLGQRPRRDGSCSQPAARDSIRSFQSPVRAYGVNLPPFGPSRSAGSTSGKNRIWTPPYSDLGVDPEAPGLPEFAGAFPSPLLRLSLPGIAPAFDQLGRQAAPGQGVTALRAANFADPLSKAHPTPCSS